VSDTRTHRRASLTFHATMLTLFIIVVLLVLLAVWWTGGHHQFSSQ
jgi:nitrogen fixation-related uncharacterized protein